MTETITFSVVIPTFNRGVKALRSVRSVLAQTYPHFEVLVVDDGSDDTEAMLRRIDSRVIYMRGGAGGVAAGRNKAIAAATGDYIAFLDADDWWSPRKLEVIAVHIARHPEVNFYYSRVQYVDAERRRLWVRRLRHTRRSRAYPLLIEANFIVTSAIVVKRSTLQEVGVFDTTLSGCEDWDLWIRIARRCRVCYVTDVLVYYEFLSEGSFTSRYRSWLLSQYEVLEKSLRLDPALTGRSRQRIESMNAYVSARICLGAGDMIMALEYMKSAVHRYKANWRALIYLLALQPTIVERLPQWARRALRFPPEKLW